MSSQLLPLSLFVHVSDDDDFGPLTQKTSSYFCSPNADLILSSSDNVHFKVLRTILTEASPTFRAALSSVPSAERGESPVVQDILEPSSVVEPLLRFIYPVPNPTVDSLDQLNQLLAAAQKYDISVALDALRKNLVSTPFIENEPIRVYAIACKYGFVEEARVASSHTLATDILSIPDMEELNQMTAMDYLRLVRLHQTRAAAAVRVLEDEQSGPMPHGCGPVVRWWTNYVEAAKEELKRRPTSKTIFEPAFVMGAVKKASSRCKECGSSYMSNGTQGWLTVLKERIDALPSTI